MTKLTVNIIGEDGGNAMVRVPETKIIDGKKQTGTVEKECTLYGVIREVLLGCPDQDIEIIEKKYDLFQKINGKDEVEFTKEEKELILSDLPTKFGVLFAGQAIKLLNNA